MLPAAAPARAAEDFSTWEHSAKLRINTTASGANVARTIGNFAMLVRITDSRILSQSMSTGADVRFADEKGVSLDFQIERWTPSAGKAEFWVRMPKVDSLSDKQFLNVHWGKPGSAWMSDGNKAFVKDAAYAMVYHLGEASTQARTNSVGNNNHAAPKNYEGDERVQGVIGMADSLDGAAVGGDYLDLGTGFADLTGFAFTAWAKPTGANQWERFLDLGNGEGIENLIFSRNYASDTLSVHAFGTPTPYNQWMKTGGMTVLGFVNAVKALESGKWAWYGFSLSGKSVTLYKNGEKVQTGELSAPLNKVVRSSNFIGHSNWPLDKDFRGVLDEVQLSSGQHSPEWMKLTYESQRPDAKMFTWEFPAEVKLAINSQPVGVTVAEGKPVKLAVIAVSAGTIAYQWMKDGVPLAGATASGYAISAATLEHSGMYTCRLTDGKDTVMSKAAAIFVPEELSTWSHSQKVFINTTASGANISAEVTNIPLLIRLGRKSIDFSQVGAGGKDLRFSGLEGAALAHSIERWGTDTAEVWVRVNKVAANATSYITMYWGKATARQGSAPGSVFSLNDGWRAYYDLNDAPSNGGDVHAQDATLNGYRGVGAFLAGGTDGPIGKCFSFNGSSSRLETPVQVIEGVKTYTIMAWVREKKTGENGNWLENPHVFGTRIGTGGQGEFGVYSWDGNLLYWNGMHAPPITYHNVGQKLGLDTWRMLALTYTGNSMTLYADGIATLSTPGENYPLPNNALAIGALRGIMGTWGGYFNGDIDAVQVTGDAKSKDWVKLAYEVQRPGAPIITFGAPAELAPPAPEIYPPAGAYDEAVQLLITCAADSARVLYTLDGSEPDTLARGSTKSAVPGILLNATATVKAKAYWKGKSSAIATAAYQITVPVAAGDTLRPGATKEIDAGHRVTFANQDSKSPVRLTSGPAWNPLPKGFDRVGPLFVLTAVDTAAAFPGLAVAGDSLEGLSLFRRNSNGNIFWMAPKEGQLWIPAAGAYFWGRDTLAPRIRFTGTGGSGDSLTARIVIDDNVSGLQGKIRWNEGKDSLGWWSATAGEVLEFAVPAPARPETPLEVRFAATDRTLGWEYPKSGSITLPRPIPSMSAPMALRPGRRWIMAGLPSIPESELSLNDLAGMSGSPPLVAAVWRDNPKPDTGYILLQGDDKLPTGKGFWIASDQGAPSLNFPASRAVASDTDGLFLISLHKGWNLVTCPSFRPLAWPISAKDGEAVLRSRLKPLFSVLDTTYTRPDSLRPWQAYYVHYDKDTTVRVGPGAPRVVDLLTAPNAPKTAALAKSLRLNLTGPGTLLDLGASAFARPGIGREDEARPPPVDDGASAWLARDGRALAVDYVAWDPGRAMAWTISSRSQAPGAAFAIAEAELPPGFEAWAVSPSRRLKWRLLPGSNIPVTGDDTLAVYAGTPAALAKIGDLQRGRTAAGAFAARLRAAAGGLELVLELPSQARLSLSVYDARGQRLGGVDNRELAPGRHALSWQALAPGRAPLPQGAYFMRLEARGPDWTRRQVQPISLIR